VSPLLRALQEPGRLPSPEERQLLAEFVAFQWARVPAMDEIFRPVARQALEAIFARVVPMPHALAPFLGIAIKENPVIQHVPGALEPLWIGGHASAMLIPLLVKIRWFFYDAPEDQRLFRYGRLPRLSPETKSKRIQIEPASWPTSLPQVHGPPRRIVGPPRRDRNRLRPGDEPTYHYELPRLCFLAP
jgi:hypothetical protein